MIGILLACLLFGTLIVQVFIPGFPKEVILFQAGAEFGLIGGTIINWLGMVVGAQVGYEVVRRSVETAGRFSQILDKYSHLKAIEYLNIHGNRGLFVLRLLPNSPNDVLSLASGALFLPRRGFVLVSIVTALPYALIFAYLGTKGSKFVDEKTLWLINLGIFCLFVIVTGAMYLRKTYFASPHSEVN